MATGSGLDAQLGLKIETTYGTPVTPDRFYEFDQESLVWAPTFREPSGIRVGRRFKRGARLAKTREAAAGNVQLQHANLSFGTLWKLAMFSGVASPTTLVAPATRQIHTPTDTIPSATIQIGRPEPESKTVRPHTYAGCVCTGWQLSVDDGETVNLQLDFDAQTESTVTALATASFPAGASLFDFSDSSNFRTGGTPTTTTGLISIASGVAVPGVVNSLQLSGDNTLALERFGLGNQGLKKAPRINDFAGYTGSLTAEYDKTTWYDPFKVGTKFALQHDFIGAAIGASGSSDTLSLIAPQIIIKGAGPQVGGPDLVMQTVEFEVYDDETNAPFQTVIISADPTTAL